MSYSYPEFKFGVEKPTYYVEFDRGFSKGTFTIFKRQFIRPPEEWAAMKKAMNMDDFAVTLMSNEGHPWNIMTDKYGPDGCMPDQSWVKWMVDALNEKCERDNKSA